MAGETKRKIWIGIMATTAAAIFLISIFLVGRKQNMFGSSFNLYAVFTNVNGLKAGDYVQFSGVRGGIVDNISFINDSMIIVKMKLDSKLQHLIMKDAVAYITTEGLVGDKIMEIKPQWKNNTPVKNSDTIIAIDPFDTHEIIEKLLSTNDNARTITANLAKLTSDINSRKSIFHTIVSDSVAATNFKDVIVNLKNASAQFNLLAEHLKLIGDKVNLDKGMAGMLLNDTALVKEVQATMDNLQKASASAASVTQQLNESMLQTKNKNTIGILMKDSTLAGNLEQSMENLKQSTQKLDESMDALQHSFLLRHYFKKKDK